jgi:hypothetical protein
MCFLFKFLKQFFNLLLRPGLLLQPFTLCPQKTALPPLTRPPVRETCAIARGSEGLKKRWASTRTAWSLGVLLKCRGCRAPPADSTWEGTIQAWSVSSAASGLCQEKEIQLPPQVRATGPEAKMCLILVLMTIIIIYFFKLKNTINFGSMLFSKPTTLTQFFSRYLLSFHLMCVCSGHPCVWIVFAQLPIQSYQTFIFVY